MSLPPIEFVKFEIIRGFDVACDLDITDHFFTGFPAIGPQERSMPQPILGEPQRMALYIHNKVKIQLQFRGRELAHTEIGFEVLEKVKEDLSSMAQVDMEPKMVGRAVNMTLSPLPPHMRERKYHATESELENEAIAHEGEEHDDEHGDGPNAADPDSSQTES